MLCQTLGISSSFWGQTWSSQTETSSSCFRLPGPQSVASYASGDVLELWKNLPILEVTWKKSQNKHKPFSSQPFDIPCCNTWGAWILLKFKLCVTLPRHNQCKPSKICPCSCSVPLSPLPLCHSPSIFWRVPLQCQESSLRSSSKWILSSTCQRSSSQVQYRP